MKLLEKAHGNWKISKNSLLLVGEIGAGMTSLLNASTPMYPEAIVLNNKINVSSEKVLIHMLQHALNLQEANSFKELAEQIEQSETTYTVIFENIERLFLRMVNGFNSLEAFLLFIHATKNKVYWICTINKYSLYYLDRTIGLSTNFLSIIRLRPFPLEYIQEVILNRTKGYDLFFLKPKVATRAFNRKVKKGTAEEKQALLQAQFFNALYNFSDGNISRSILFWKNSIMRVRDKKVYIRKFEPKAVENISLDELFILEAIMQHSSLSSEELNLIFRSTSTSNKLALAYLMEKNYVFPKYYENTVNPEYQLNLLYLKPIKQMIHSRLNRNIK